MLKSILIGLVFFTIGIILTFIYGKQYLQLVALFTISLLIPGIFVLTSAMTVYHKKTFADLMNFSRLAKQNGAKEIFSYGGYKPILVYYGRIPVDFSDKKIQLKKIKESVSSGKQAFIIGYLSDLDKNKPIVRKNKDLFERLTVIKAGKKYFLGRFD